MQELPTAPEQIARANDPLSLRHVAITEEQQRAGTAEYNYRRETEDMSGTTQDEGPVKGAAISGTDLPTYAREGPA